jgi:hypothetical protein
VPALFSFNLGVEVGQLALVLALFPVLLWMRSRGAGGLVVQVTSFAGVVLGTAAFIVRAFG